MRVESYGGPDRMEWGEVPDPRPGPGQALVTVLAAGVNYIDTYHRTGLYPVELPFTPGLEGAGVVRELGKGTEGLEVGDRVAWSTCLGSYAEQAVGPAERMVPVPPGVEIESAAGLLLQGITAHFLANDTFPLQEGDRALVHAGAGGVGLLLIQLAKRRGAEVFTTVGDRRKGPAGRERRRRPCHLLPGDRLRGCGGGDRRSPARWMSSMTGWGRPPSTADSRCCVPGG